MLQTTDFYPYLLEGVAKEKVWGGRNLETRVGKTLPPDKLIGETWEAWDGCRILNGPHRGRTLGELLAQFPDEILGEAAQGSPRFPLLLKFLDAQDDLSIQVHPDDKQAQEMEHYPYGKTEAWYILHAAPDGYIIHGFNAEVERATILQKLSEKRMDELLTKVTLQTGDVIFVPAGTVHAIGKGVVLAEIQENSDITYRFYDWGRDAKGTGRELHIEQSLAVANLKKQAEHKIETRILRGENYEREFLVVCRYFSFERLTLRAATPGLKLSHRFHILSIIEGEAEISFADRHERAGQGQTVIIPAIADEYAVTPMRKPCVILRAYVPDIRQDVIEPLRAAGLTNAQIVNLGGPRGPTNDIEPLV